MLLAYGGGSIKKNGVYDELMSILKAAGKNVTEFTGIMSNPTYAKVQEGAKLAKDNKMNISADTDFRAIADTTILTDGCAKKFTSDELYQILLECR